MSITLKKTILVQAASLAFVATLGGLSGCSLAPAYHVPTVETGAAFRESGQMTGQIPEQTAVHTPAGNEAWKPATPETVATAHWEAFNLPELPGLLAKLEKANPTLDESKAAYEEAGSLIAQAKAGLMPTLSATASGSRAKSQGVSASSSSSTGLSASWELDLWGKQANTVKEQEASAAASAADLAAERLSLQGELVQSLLSLRTVVLEKQLLEASVADYERYLTLVTAQVEYGTSSAADVATAQTQLENARATAVDVDVQKKELEHAIAVLVGEAPATFTVPQVPVLAGDLRAPVPVDAVPVAATQAGAPHATMASGAVHGDISATLPVLPVVPLGTPSALLQRRPDIASAERKVAAANYQVGVANAAFFPTVTLTGGFGQSTDGLVSLLSAPAQYWSLGPSVSVPLFEGGLLKAEKAQAVAQWKEASATYRATVLSALQEVEDQLATLNTLSTEYQVDEKAVEAARSSATLTLAQYQAGTATGLQVIAANASLLTAENTLVTLYGRRLTAAVTLMEDTGGGWKEGA